MSSPITWKNRNRDLVIIGVAVAAVIYALVAAGGGTEGPGRTMHEPGLVTRESMGDRWPLTVASVVLRCERPNAVVARADGVDYAVNGMAATVGYPDIEPIWRDDPDRSGSKINIGPLINAGLELCD